ncbi:UNVERIFIED_CONTAM: hypothetical protein Slati_1124000 [Sesamum latifolium]|uniref:Exo_endo_phos domain-containing protein n=1 Tax=Sesamum latifolium TaxID=2727402 RepID=A0AAW2XBJ0_9LAMI
MIALSWNCRGLGSSSTVRKLGEVLREKCPTCRRKEELGYSIIVAKGCGGSIAIFFRFHIDVEVLQPNTVPSWRFTGFYGATDTSQQRKGWDTLMTLRNQSDAPWLCTDDFNEVLFRHEKVGALRPLWQILDFRRALEACDLTDLGYSGSKFTRSNRRRALGTVRTGLDQACANSAWMNSFTRYVVTHIPVYQSDHNMVLVEMETQSVNRN